MSDPNHKSAGSPCPDIETLAAHVDGTLGPDDRGTVVEHLADCDTCTEVVAEVVRANEALRDEAGERAGSDHRAVPHGTSPHLAGPAQRQDTRAGSLRALETLAAAAVLLITTGGAWYWWAQRPPGTSDPLRQLVAAAGETRAVEGRMTGGFSYGVFRTPDRGISPSGNLALIAAAGELQKAADADPTPANLHAWGVAQLVLGQYDGGVGSLELANVEHGATAALAADLATGYLARATTSDRPEDLPKALESAEDALRIDPKLPEAWFTKAIVLERLQMLQQARDAWESYLRLDPTSPWSAEARDRLARLLARSSGSRWREIEESLRGGLLDERLLREAVASYGADLRELLVRDLLSSWAARPLSAEPEGDLSSAARVAAALEQHAGDRSFSRALTHIRRMPRAERMAALTGLQELGAGLRAQSDEQSPGEVRSHLEAALTGLRPVRSSLHLWAELGLARLASSAHLHDEVRARAATIAREAQRVSAPSLEARAHWLLGMTAFTTGGWAEARRHYDRALQICAASTDDSLAATVHLNASVLSRFLGDRRGTWAHRLAAAELLPVHRTLQVHTFLTTGAVTASTESLPHVALLFQNEVVANALAHLRTGPRAEARISRARMLARLDRFEDAKADLAEAQRLVSAVEAEPMQARLTRAWLLAAAEIHLPRDPAQAARHAREALSLISSSGEPMRVAEAALLESRALSRLGDNAAALVSAQRGMDAFERSLASVDPRDASRVSALEPMWALYSHASRLHLVEGPTDLAEAFQTVERGRARTLLDLRRIAPLTLADVRGRLGEAEGVLLLDQSDDDLITWWITRNAVRTTRVPVGAAAAGRLILTHRRSVDDGQRRHGSSAELFDLAIRPWWSDLRAKTTVAVVPDGAWNRVAWPALWDAESNAELVFSTGIVVAPSASVALRERPGRPDGIISALVIAAPATAGERELPGARAESRAISRFYPAATLIEGPEATPARLMEGAAKADVLHVSSHAVDVTAYPQLSHLALAGEGDQGKLFVRDLVGADLSHTRLVVLAACSTAGRTAVRGEGSVGVAWGFLTAGVRQVIATLQDVEDGPAATLFAAVHRRLAAGDTPARALQITQRELAASGESPRLWAVVTLLGTLH